MRLLLIILFHTLVLLMFSSCSNKKLTQQQKFDAYSEALATTKTLAVSDFQSEPEKLSAPLTRLKKYYDNITVESVRDITKDVYAENAFLCDTLHIARGADEIEEYFVKTAERVNSMRVEILDYGATGSEVYARWTMSISADELADGKTVTTYGMYHFRMDAEGKVILHQDFWDTSAGFFELLPLFGGAIQRVRGNL